MPIGNAIGPRRPEGRSTQAPTSDGRSDADTRPFCVSPSCCYTTSWPCAAGRRQGPRRQTEMIRPWIVGFKTTFGHMFKKPITVNYPDEKVPMFPKWRGKQVLMRDENGLEKCVACGLCAVACPADAIYLEAGRERRQRDGRAAVCPDVPDSQDPLHLLRVLRRGLPGVGHLHGQGLRTGRVQQGRLRLGQGRPPGARWPGQAQPPATRK